MFIYLFVSALTLLVIYIKWNFSYWERKGFPYVEPKIPCGVLDSIVKRETSLGIAIYNVYNNSTERVLGIYLFLRPALLIRDAHLVKNILMKDFNSFHDRGVYVNEKRDPLQSSLFTLKGTNWKTLRSKLAPSFTAGKIKAMFGTVEDISLKMVAHLNKLVPDEGIVTVEMRKVVTTYAIDIVASVLFGLDVDSFSQPDNEFYMLKQKINEPNFCSVLRGTTQFVYPAFEQRTSPIQSLEQLFVFFGWFEEGQQLMKEIVSKTVDYRDKNNIIRKDMLQMLLQLRNTGSISTDDNVWAAQKKPDFVNAMSIDSITAQLFLFYIAGYETSASAVAFTVYELSQYPDLMAKAQQDVEQAIQKHDNKLTYEAILDMKFLELCVMETIRKYPGLPILNRECTIDYPIPDTKKVIKKGTPLIISLLGMHRDAKYFPDPMRYDPERFLEENMRYEPDAYLPFGEGPRHCIAQRMGVVNVKVALSQILTNFVIETRDERVEIEIDNFGIPIQPKGGINVRLAKKPKPL